MAFNLIDWFAGFVLTKIVNRFFSPDVKDYIYSEVRKWINEKILQEESLSEQALLPVLVENEVEHHPKLSAVYAKLSSHILPEAGEWKEALLEQWNYIRENIKDPQNFFTISQEEAEAALTDLAERIQKACLKDDLVFKLYCIEQQRRTRDAVRESGESIPPSHIPVHRAVLHSLSAGIPGAGVKSLLEHNQKIAKAGTLMFVWKLGSKSPRLMLADYVHDGIGEKDETLSRPYSGGTQLMVFLTWEKSQISLAVNGELFGPVSIQPFEYLGPLILFGNDIEGKLSADAVKWSAEESEPGLCFKKDNIWHGSIWKLALLWERLLREQEISQLTQDPYSMFRPRLCIGHRCPDCNGPVRVDTKVREPEFVPKYPNVWCICTDCGRPCLSTTGIPA